MSNHHYFAEIVESSLHTWVAQCWQWAKHPAFGSLVALDMHDKQVYAIVYDVKIGSGDPHRYPVTYQKTEQELLAEYPHIFEFIKTTFFCLPIGYEYKKAYYHLLPPEPAKIHAFVRAMSIEEQQDFFQKADFLSLMFHTPLINQTDELMLALIKQLHQYKVVQEEQIHVLLDTFTLMAGNDYRRLKLFTQRLSNALQ